MAIADEINVLLKACNTGIWIVGQEPAEIEREITTLLNNPNERHNALFSWDIHNGVTPLYQGQDAGIPATPGNNRSPQGAIEVLSSLGRTVSLEGNGYRVLLLHNFHRFLHLPDVVQGLANELQAGKQTRTFAIVLTPSLQLPVELRTYFTTLQHELPNRNEIEQVVRELFPEETKDKTIPSTLLDAAAGLTRYEVENAFSISLVKEGKLSARPIFDYKARALAKDGTLSVYRGTEGFSSLGGLQGVKDFCTKCLTPRASRKSVAKGIIALGVSGAGKSAFAKALGHEINRPTVILDIASLLSKYVGESEGRLKQALHTLEAISPCVCMIDEVEKGLSGVGSGLDSGVMDRLFGTLLTWRQDTKADVFVIATCNAVDKMPAPMLRAGRTNAIFFFDLPSREEKDAIWSMYLRQYELAGNEENVLPDDANWTGAEIKNACELADLLGVTIQEAAQMVVPISTTSKNQIDELRCWADRRVLSASVPGIYQKKDIGAGSAQKAKTTKRRSLKPGNENLN